MQPFFKLFQAPSVDDVELMSNIGTAEGVRKSWEKRHRAEPVDAAVTPPASPQDEPIIKSILDDDFYDFTVASVIHDKWPDAVVDYEFNNRAGTKFPPGFGAALQHQVNEIGKLELNPDEAEYLRARGIFPDKFIDWLKDQKMDPKQVSIEQNDGDLKVHIHGKWSNAIFWEVKLLATISELYFKKTGQVPDHQWTERIDQKAHNMSAAGVNWMDMGTRRRFSQGVHDEVVRRMKGVPGFMGTSNVALAKKYDVPVKGTSSHQAIMGLSALVGPAKANQAWNEAMLEHFGGKLAVALPDTFTTDVFLRDFDKPMADKLAGLRQDSGDPNVFADKVLAHYDKLGVDTKTKTLMFSDSLNAEKAIALHNKYKDRVNVASGIGTNLTADVFHGSTQKPLNMVVKLVKADFGKGPVNVVKISDSPGKHNGDPFAVHRVKKELGIE